MVGPGVIGWSSYNAVARAYARVAEVPYFARPAQDLVTLIDPGPGARFLDIGSGSGAVARAAARAVGPSGRVVGLDPALAMLLAWGERQGPGERVVGSLPHLPHPAGAFDAVAAAFVLTHVIDPDAALLAVGKALGPRGKVGLSSWAASPSVAPPGEAWAAVVDRFVGRDELARAMASALPWEERFSTRDGLALALRDAGFEDVRVEQRDYDVEMSTDSFVESRLLSLPSRYMESHLPPATWARFRATASRELTDRFGPQLRLRVGVNFAVARR